MLVPDIPISASVVKDINIFVLKLIGNVTVYDAPVKAATPPWLPAESYPYGICHGSRGATNMHVCSSNATRADSEILNYIIVFTCQCCYNYGKRNRESNQGLISLRLSSTTSPLVISQSQLCRMSLPNFLSDSV